jgi:hypothetical protein
VNQIYNFIDLCSVSNISVFILDETYHGYYIHGRSPHGKADVNIKEILINFDREIKRMTGTRGLENYSNDQIFIMKINENFRKQYELLFRNYYVRIFIDRLEFSLFCFCLELLRTTSNKRRFCTLYECITSILSNFK